MLKLAANPSRAPRVLDPDGTILVPDSGYLDAVRRTLGLIDLDPCSSAKAQEHIQAQGWFRADQADAALAEPWGGRVFLHPHPNARTCRFQIQKLLRDYLAHRVSAAVILSARTDLLRCEPLLLSFPFVLHYQRLPHWRWDQGALVRHSPSWNSVTHYLPALQGSSFDEEALARFHAAFSSYGRFVLAEDYDGEDWQDMALLATRRMTIQPVLTAARINRHGA